MTSATNSPSQSAEPSDPDKTSTQPGRSCTSDAPDSTKGSSSHESTHSLVSTTSTGKRKSVSDWIGLSVSGLSLVVLILSVFGVPLYWLLTTPPPDVRVGSKEFTEGIILGEFVTLLAEQAGVEAKHKEAMGGTRVVFNALLAGTIDAYPEYNGTLIGQLLAELKLENDQQLREALLQRRIKMTEPLGFENSFAIGMKREDAQRLGIETIEDLQRYPDLRMGFTDTFVERPDGWPAIKAGYSLPQQDVRAVKHELAYKLLDAGDLDVVDFYTTDAEIQKYDLQIIEDNRSVFPEYQAFIIYRQELEQTYPEVVRKWRSFANGSLPGIQRLNQTLMQGINHQVVEDHKPERLVAATFLGSAAELSSRTQRVLVRTAEHLVLVGVAMTLGVIVAIPLGYAAAKNPTTSQAIFGVVGIIQTIPSLALLALMIPFLAPVLNLSETLKDRIDPSYPPAIAALFLYSMLPIVRNTYTGLKGISVPVQESAEALGLSPLKRLWKVELPLASPSILAGIKTSTVLIIGFATLGVLIGAGGYGQPILKGIRLDRIDLLLEGTLPAAGMAIFVQLAFDQAEKLIVPRGLRLKRTS